MELNAKRVKQVLEEFCNGNVTTDKLLVDKLLECLQQNLKDIDLCIYFLEATKFWSFVAFYLDKETRVLHGEVWSLMLQLIGYIDTFCRPVYTESCYEMMLFTQAHDDNRLWCQACVREAWLHGLTLLTAEVEMWIYNTEYLKAAVKCMFDDSWFVRRNALILISSTVEHLITLSISIGTLNNTRISDIIRKVLKLVVPTLSCDYSNQLYEQKHLVGSLAIIKHLNFSGVEYWCTLFSTSSHIIVSRLFLLLRQTAESLDQGHELILLNAFSQLCENEVCRHEVHQQLFQFLCWLLDEGNVLMAISVSSLALNWRTTEVDVSLCKNVVALPIMTAIYMDSVSNFSSSHQRLLCRVVNCLSSNKRLHLTAVKLSLSCMLAEINCSSVISYACDLLMSTYDCSTKAYHLASNTNLRLFCLNSCKMLLNGHIQRIDTGCREVCQVLQVLLMLMHKSCEDYSIFSKALCVSSEAIVVCYAGCDSNADYDSSCQHDLGWFLSIMSTIVQKAISSVAWNVRDSVLEFFGSLFNIQTNIEAVCHWIIENSWHNAVWQAVNDSDYFVRATSLTALTNLYKSSQLWLDFTSVHVPVEVINTAILEKFYNDPSEYVRRAALILLCEWNTLQSDDLLKALYHAIGDIDRETRRIAVNFLETCILSLTDDGSIPHVTFQYADLLITATSDCDILLRIDALKALCAVKPKLVSTSNGSKSSVAEGITGVTKCSFEFIVRVKSVLSESDWKAQLDLENSECKDCCNGINAVLDDIMNNLFCPSNADYDIVIDCY